MDPRIRQLRSTTFGGERLTRRQIAAIQETVGTFPKLSRTELGHTICVHLGWQTPTGRNRIQQAQGLLEELERLGILTLPARQGRGRGPQKLVETGAGSDPQPAIAGPLAELRPLELAVASGRGGGRRVERMGAALSPAGLPPADRQPRAVLAARPQGAPAGLSAVRLRGAAGGLPGPLDRLGGGGLSEVSATGRAECPLPAVAVDGCIIPPSLHR